MNIEQVIVQIRAAAPVFKGNVAGAARYANAIEDQVWLPRPACYVIPADMDAGENQSLTSNYQLVTERIGVIVDLDNSLDRRGQNSAVQLGDYFYAVCRAILNWRPDWNPLHPERNTQARGFYFVAGEVVLMDRARLHYQFVFGLDITLSDADGWLPQGDPLREITGQTIRPDTGAPLPAGFDITFPQT